MNASMSNRPDSQYAKVPQTSLASGSNSKLDCVDTKANGNNPGSEEENLSKTAVPSPSNYGFVMTTSPYPAPHSGHDSNMTPSMFFKEMNRYSTEKLAHGGNLSRLQCDPNETPLDVKDSNVSKAAVLTVSASSKDLQGVDRTKAIHAESFKLTNDKTRAQSQSIQEQGRHSNHLNSDYSRCDVRGSAVPNVTNGSEPPIGDVLEDDISPTKTGELPRRLLTFEASPDEKVGRFVPGSSAASNPQGYRMATESADAPVKTNDMMTPLDGRHHSQPFHHNQHLQEYQTHQSMRPPSERQVDQRQHKYQEYYNENDSSRSRYNQNQNSFSNPVPKEFHSSPLFDPMSGNTPNYDGRFSATEDLGSAPPFEPSPSLDRFHMPIMDIHSGLRSDSKQFEDYLMGSPALNWSITRSGGKSIGGSVPRDVRANRRVTYDLHDDPAFNDHHNSPITAPRANSSASRYYTPIITSGNDRQPINLHSNDSTFSYHSDKNYRPSPPDGGVYDDYDHLRHYHRTFPTMRGHHPSPMRYDASYQPPTSVAREPMESPMYATPVMPRAGPYQKSYGSGVGDDRKGLGLGPQGQSFGMPAATAPHQMSRHVNHMGGYYGGRTHAPNTYPPHNFHPTHYIPRQDPRYPPPHHMPYIGAHPHYPPGYPSPYQYMPHTVDVSMRKKRKINDGTKKPSRNPKRKKMYSDFVGVTYNKTHAKFQACITHYRKQHYLGRYKLACDAAKAYDQSAKMLKGDTWKINFQSEEEYQAARERELREVEEKRNLSGPEVENLRESFVSNFPSEATLREKLGIDDKNCDSGDKTSDQNQGMDNKQDNAVSKPHLSRQALMAQQQPMVPTSVPTPASTSNAASSSTKDLSDYSDKKNDTVAHGTTTNANQTLAKSAVTPSPNVFNNLTKNSSTLMTEPLMSPAFKMGSSPSAHSLLGGTPFSMPGSSVKFNSSGKNQSENIHRDLGPVSSNIFQSPFMKDFAVSTAKPTGMLARERNDCMSKMEEGDDSDDKGKGDLTAASALLMMNGN